MASDSTALVLQVGHVGLNVSNLKRSSTFYQEVFGLQLLGESTEAGHQYAFLGLPSQTILTIWQQSETKFNKHSSGLHHLAFRVDSIAALQETQAKLRKMGVALLYDDIVPHAEGSASGAIYFEDPDGIRLEIFSPEGAEGYEKLSEGVSCGFF